MKSEIRRMGKGASVNLKFPAIRQRRAHHLGLWLIALASPAWGAIDSVYSDLGFDAPCALIYQHEESGAAMSRCPGVAGFDVIVEYDDDRMSATLAAPDGRLYPLDLWQHVSNAFSSLGAKGEWRVERNGDKITPFAFIVRFNAEEDPGKNPASYLTVSKISEQEICLAAIIPPQKNINILARQMADEIDTRKCHIGDEVFPLELSQDEEVPIAKFRAEITPRDRLDEQGKRLYGIDILLRDRENLHRFQRQDPGDEKDDFTRTGEGRKLFRRLLEEYHEVGPGTWGAIVNGSFLGHPFDPTLTISIYSDRVVIWGEGIDGDCGCDCVPAGEEC